MGNVLDWLEENDLDENTIVFFLSDHGEAFLRGKCFLYDSGLNQPLIVRWPQGCKPPQEYLSGSSSDRLLCSTDLTAQTLSCAGGSIPSWMHGQAFLGPDAKNRQEVFSAADWIGGSRIKSRSVRTNRYKYIRNYTTDLSISNGSSEYRKAMHPMYHLVEVLAERDELSDLHRTLLLDPLPEEELYDLQRDPHEMNNLADSPDHATLKEDLHTKLDEWIEESGDLGFDPLEPEHEAFFRGYREKPEQDSTEEAQGSAGRSNSTA